MTMVTDMNSNINIDNLDLGSIHSFGWVQGEVGSVKTVPVIVFNNGTVSRSCTNGDVQKLHRLIMAEYRLVRRQDTPLCLRIYSLMWRVGEKKERVEWAKGCGGFKVM